MRTLVVIPTFEEAESIETAVRGVRAAVPDADVLVVDDSSPDGTAGVVERLGREMGRVELLSRAQREGLGPAYRAGWAWALDHAYELVVSMDADGSHDPGALPSLLAAAASGADLVIGSRYVHGGAVPNWGLHRLVLSRAGNRYAGALLGLPIRDATGGYRVYRADLMRRLGLSTLSADGYGFQIELVYRSARAGARIVEVPITFVDRTVGTSKMSGSIIREALLLVTWWAVRDRVLHRRGLRPAGKLSGNDRGTP